MAKRKEKVTPVQVAHEGDVTVTPEGYRILGINWYIRRAKAAIESREWADAWFHLGSARVRCADSAEDWDLKMLEKKAYKMMLNRKTDRKKDKDKRRKRTEYA